MADEQKYPGLILRLHQWELGARLAFSDMLREAGYSARAEEVRTWNDTTDYRISVQCKEHLQEWMRSRPELLSGWWQHFFPPTVYRELQEQGRKVRHPRPQTLTEVVANIEQEKPMMPETKETALAEHFVTIARAVRKVNAGSGSIDVSARYLSDPKVLLITVEGGAARLKLVLKTKGLEWTAAFESTKADGAIHVEESGLLEVVAVAWDVYEAIDPDAFPGGTEGLYNALIDLVTEAYGLGDDGA